MNKAHCYWNLKRAFCVCWGEINALPDDVETKQIELKNEWVILNFDGWWWAVHKRNRCGFHDGTKSVFSSIGRPQLLSSR
jgi:hypothetical protein